MLTLSILSIFVLLVSSIIVFEIRNERKYQATRRKKQEVKKEKQTIPKDPYSKKIIKKIKTEKKAEKKLPICTYPKFTHARLLEMGLSDEESKEFVKELIPQLEIQIPLIEEVLGSSDFHQMERLTHSIKGSSTNLGTGGISDLLVECNTYLKSGKDIEIAKAYFGYLKHYTQELKEQYI